MTSQEIVTILVTTRKKKGFTQTDMAEKLNITQVQYSNYESGKSDLSLSKFLELLKILDINIADFSDEENKSKEEVLTFIEKQEQILKKLKDKINT
jgi:transcriptional regulator with XRE-family HTH domain